MDRKPLLIGLLAVVGLGFGLDAAYRTYVEKPFADQEKKRASLEKQRKDYRSKLMNVKTLVRDLPPLQESSLPADPAAARQQYLAWWWQTIKNHQWENPVVDMGQPTPIDLDRKNKTDTPIHQLTGTVRGTATLQQVTDLLDQFYATPLLHQVQSIQMTPVAGGQALSVKLTLSALSLPNATHADQLPEDVAKQFLLVDQDAPAGSVAELLKDPSANIATSTPIPEIDNDLPSAADTSSQAETSKADAGGNTESLANVSPEISAAIDGSTSDNSTTDPSDDRIEDGQPTAPWQTIVKRNLFQAGGGMQIARDVTVSAITQDADGNQQAWFRATTPKRTEIVNQGQTFRMGVLSAKVLEAESDSVTLLIEGAKVKVRIGQPLANGQIVP